MKPIDAYIEVRINSFIERVENEAKNDPSSYAFVNAAMQLEFFSREEWAQIKSGLDTDDDTLVVAHIEQHAAYTDRLLPKFGQFAADLRFDDRPDQFCSLDFTLQA